MTPRALAVLALALLPGCLGAEDAPRTVEATVTFLERDGTPPRPWRLDPAEVVVPAGATVRFTLVSPRESNAPHNLSVPALAWETAPQFPGTTTNATFVAERAGRFTLVCGYAGHAGLGMTGTLVVE